MYAVKESEIGGRKRVKKAQFSDSDDDFEFLPPKKKVSLGEIAKEIKDM